MWMMAVGKVCVISLFLMGIVSGMSRIIKKLDDTWNQTINRTFNRVQKGGWCVLILMNGTFIFWLNVPWMESLLITVFAGSLLFACITDIRIHQVYQVTWWMAGMAEAVLFCLKIYRFREQWCTCTDVMAWGKWLAPLLLFGVLQECFFCKMYGRADCHAFLSCAVMEWVLGMEMKTYLIQMLLAIVLLAVIQLFHKNINRQGNLIKPVPFLPYITISFWIIMWIRFP